MIKNLYYEINISKHLTDEQKETLKNRVDTMSCLTYMQLELPYESILEKTNYKYSKIQHGDFIEYIWTEGKKNKFAYETIEQDRVKVYKIVICSSRQTRMKQLFNLVDFVLERIV